MSNRTLAALCNVCMVSYKYVHAIANNPKKYPSAKTIIAMSEFIDPGYWFQEADDDFKKSMEEYFHNILD